MATPLATTQPPRSYPLFYSPIANLSPRAWFTFSLATLALLLYPILFSHGRAELFKLNWMDLVFICLFIPFELVLRGSTVLLSYILKARRLPIMAPETVWHDSPVSPEDSRIQVWGVRISMVLMLFLLMTSIYPNHFLPLGFWLFINLMGSKSVLSWLSLQPPRFAVSEYGLRSDQSSMTRFYPWDCIDHAIWKQGTYCPRLFLHIREKSLQPLHPQCFYFNDITDQQRDELLTLLEAHIPVTRA